MVHIAIIGGGIAGTSVASTLLSSSSSLRSCIKVDLFDQGRSGVGGRTSHRVNGTRRHWDHGCQFFRADTPRFKAMVQTWIQQGMAAEWDGVFTSDSPEADFFGLPHCPPFYVGIGGIHTIPQRLLLDQNMAASGRLKVYTGHRVASMQRNDDTKKWTLFGTAGDAAFHDTPETTKATEQPLLTLGHGYDAVVLTDVSSSFDAWHRASAGVPLDFAARVRTRAGARVPLFACFIAFETPLPISVSAASFAKDDRLWFAARTKSKPGFSSDMDDCWTLVSTPDYAIQAIKDTPMQDPITGQFIPQSSDCLNVPGAQLEDAFRSILSRGGLGFDAIQGGGKVPKTTFLGAQRWGSAMPAHKHLNELSPTRQILSGVVYDSGKGPLAPTTIVVQEWNDGNDQNFIADNDQMLFQAGDMVSMYTPGFEGAALSGIDLGEYLTKLLFGKGQMMEEE